MNDRPTKDQLLNQIHSEWKKLESNLVGLSDDQFTKPGVQDDWTIKDIMAHIASWERLATDRLSAALTGNALNSPIIRDWDDIHKYNAETIIENRAKSLHAVMEEFQTAHKDIVNAVEGLDADLLNDILPFDWADDTTFAILISANTHWHYKEHCEQIENWLASSS
jgi:hypothetical protein